MADRRGLIAEILVLAAIGVACVLVLRAGAGSPGAAALDCRPDEETSGLPPTPTQPEVPGARIQRHCLNEGVGDPWGTAFDAGGNLWVAEPGCDFAPTCPATTPPGQIGEIAAGSNRIRHFTLPDIAGNQPVFVQPDGGGHIWFTTPNNSMIGEFDPFAGRFIGQWPVSFGSGPWDLAFSNGVLWYTEHFVSAVGRFDPVTHLHTDVPTPSGTSNPYGIAADDTIAPGRVWFTENNPEVARIGVVDSAQGDRISEFPVRAEPPQTMTLTPHMITIDHAGGIWWTEGSERMIGHLEPNEALTDGACGTASGSCTGIHEYLVSSPAGCPQSHISGIAVDKSAPIVWFDDSLSSQLGNINTVTDDITMLPLQGCSSHAHDGLAIDPRNHVWWDEEFANALGELVR